MMSELKGVSKRVIEIVEPQHAYIERVLVVLKADSPPVRVGTRRSEAEKYVASLVCWRRSVWPHGVRGWCVALGCTMCLAALTAAIFLL